MTAALTAALNRFGLTAPIPLAETSAARLWRVRGADGTDQVLKLYARGHKGNEETGSLWLERASAAGAPVVAVLAQSAEAVVMPLLKGPLLGDLARGGHDDAACATLADLARRIHGAGVDPGGLAPLDQWMEPVLALGCGTDCPQPLRQGIIRAQVLVRQFLATAPAPAALHGDLHHDNVIVTATGPVAIDAKGIAGDPAFELANALRNPRGMADRVLDSDRQRACLDRYATAMRVPKARLTAWAAVKVAHSMALRAQAAPLGADREAPLLLSLLELAAQTPLTMDG